MMCSANKNNDYNTNSSIAESNLFYVICRCHFCSLLLILLISIILSILSFIKNIFPTIRTVIQINNNNGPAIATAPGQVLGWPSALKILRRQI